MIFFFCFENEVLAHILIELNCLKAAPAAPDFPDILFSGLHMLTSTL